MINPLYEMYYLTMRMFRRTPLRPRTRRYLTEWLEWAESGAGQHCAFHRGFGLCAGAITWEGYMHNDVSTNLFDLFCELKTPEPSYPFGSKRYYVQQRNQTMHQCERRLAWVRKQLERS